MMMYGAYDEIFGAYFGPVPELDPIKIGMILVGPRNDKGWSHKSVLLTRY